MTPPHQGPRDRAPARVGQVLRGKWRLDELLAVGGMASVFAATHRNGKRGAVKLLHYELSLNEEQKNRFLREGYVANKVDHEGAVSVLDDDIGDDGTVFLVMELLDGQTVDAVLRSRKSKTFGLGETLRVADRLLDVLAAAHDKGIVHRDIKPENIFLTRDGKLKVLDFGIARLREAHASADATRAGDLLGTPSFMPPEQALGNSDQVDPRSDLWSVGATMFRLLTGRTVHHAESINRVLLAAMTMPAPPIARVLPSVPPQLANLVDVALAFEQKDRWPDARTMRSALRVYADAASLRMDGPVQPTPEEARARATTIQLELSGGHAADPYAPALTPAPSFAPPQVPSPYAPPPPPAGLPSQGPSFGGPPSKAAPFSQAAPGAPARPLGAPPAAPRGHGGAPIAPHVAAAPPRAFPPPPPPQRPVTAVLPPGSPGTAPVYTAAAPGVLNAPAPDAFDPSDAKTTFLATGSSPTPSALRAGEPSQSGLHPHVPTFSTAVPVSRDPTFGGPGPAVKTRPLGLVVVLGAAGVLGALAAFFLVRGGAGSEPSPGAGVVATAPAPGGPVPVASTTAATAEPLTATPPAESPSASAAASAPVPVPAVPPSTAPSSEPSTEPGAAPAQPPSAAPKLTGTLPSASVKRPPVTTGPKNDPFGSRKW